MHRLLQHRNWSFRTTFLWLFAGLLFSLNMSEPAFVAVYAWSQTCSYDTREDANNYMTDFHNVCIGTECCLFCLKSFLLCGLIPLRIFLSLAVSLGFRNCCGSGRLSFASDWLVRDWNCMSLLSNIVHVPSTENTLPLSSQRRLSFLLNSWSLSATSLRTLKFRASSDQCEVLQMSSIVNNLFAHYFEWFLDRTKPKQILLGSHLKAFH